MKKFLIVLLFSISFTCFAETKILNGIGCSQDYFTSKNDVSKSVGLFFEPSYNFGVESNYEYFEENLLLNFAKSYINLSSTTKVKYSIFYISNVLEFENNVKYCDFGLGVHFGGCFLDWLKFYCDGQMGFLPFYEVGTRKLDNLFKTSLQIEILMFDCLFFYAGMESKQKYLSFFCYNPFLVRNNIGLKFEWTFNDFGFYTFLKYFCEHPENGWNRNNTSINRNKFLCSIGFFYKI